MKEYPWMCTTTRSSQSQYVISNSTLGTWLTVSGNRKTRCPRQNISRRLVANRPPCLLSISVSSSVNGPRPLPIVPNTSMAAVLVPGMTDPTPVPPELGAALATLGAHRLLARVTGRSFANSGRHRPSRTKRGMAGFNGPGRPKTQTSGPIRRA